MKKIILALAILIWLFINIESKNDQYEEIIAQNIVTLAEIDSSILEVAEVVVEEKEMAYKITEEERDILAKLVYLEARGESVECQRAVVSVVLNRVNSPYWGTTIEKVVYSKNQFTPAKYINKTIANEECYASVDYVLENGCTVPEYVLYFRADYFFSWASKYEKIDQTCFSYIEKDKKNFLAGKWEK